MKRNDSRAIMRVTFCRSWRWPDLWLGLTERMDWEDMVKAVSTMNSIVVYTTPVNACIFPKKDLGDRKYKVIEMISTHMPPQKVKIRG